MSFLVCSDLHITEKCPANRKEPDWMQLCLDKFDQMLKYAKDQKASHLLVAGDFFDKYTHSLELVHKVVYLMQDYQDYVQIIILPGNHDLKSHSIDLSIKSSITTVGLANNCFVCSDLIGIDVGDLTVDFIPFGSELSYNGGDIALIHEFVYKNKPTWAEDGDSGSYKRIIKKMKGYKLIVAGDNHQPFIAKHRGCTLLNCGSMMRRKIDQQDHKPMFYHVNKDLKIESIPFKIEKDVFNFDAVDMIQKKNAAIEEVAEQMKKNIEFKLDYKDNMEKYLRKNKVDSEICEMIKGAME